MDPMRLAKVRYRVKQAQRTQILISPFGRFIEGQAAGGKLLIFFTILAILAANIPFLQPLHEFWGKELSVSFNYNTDYLPLKTIGEWINDGLMVIFFFSVGLEIKRQILVGELSSVRKATLPIFAAVGGMLIPAIIYFCINYFGNADIDIRNLAVKGFGIPMATDIAFTIGILSMLGKKVPPALKIFLIALAIADDLGAILVLAIFYPSHAIVWGYLLLALLVTLLLSLLNYLRINMAFPYIFLGILLWLFVLKSGIHATVAGVILAMTIPTSIKVNQIRFFVRSKYMLGKFREAYNNSAPLLKNEEEQEQLHNLEREISRATPLLLRLEHSIQPWVTFFILPLFALSNAGVAINAESFGMLTSTVSLGIFFGLLFGKPIGIFLFSFIAIKLRFGTMPEKTGWNQLLGAGILAGIGFTMSLFIDSLAFSNNIEFLNIGKLSILITSILAGLLGYLYMSKVCKKEI